jgi:hypothetical protein
MAICAGGYHSLALAADGTLMAWGENSAGQSNVPYGNNFVAVAAGLYHSLALKADGTVVAWGDNSRGQTSVPRNTKFRAIAAGTWHTLGIRMDGSIAAWGWNESRQCDPPLGKDYAEVCGGFYHSLALKTDGTLVAWGSNGDGQASVPEGNDFIHIAAGTVHSLALKADGTIVAWGRNSEGQCRIPSGNDFVAISAGSLHNLALRRDGRVEAWGQDSYNQLVVPEGGRYAVIAAGNFHSLAIRDLRKQFPSAEAVQMAKAAETAKTTKVAQPRTGATKTTQPDATGVLTGEDAHTPLPDAGLTGQTSSGISDLVLEGQIPDADSARTENLLNRLEQRQPIPIKPVDSAAAVSPTAQKQTEDPNAGSKVATKPDRPQATTPPTTPAQVKDPNTQQATVPPVTPAKATAPAVPPAATQKQAAATGPAKPPVAAVAEPEKPGINFEDPANQGYAPSIYMGVIENAAPVYHFVSTTSKRHFCTISEDEKYKLLDTQPTAWKYQGIAFFAYPDGQQPEGSRPVYRFWSESLKQHFYTMDEATKDMMVKEMANVWKYECVAWYAPAPKQPGQKK